MHAKSDTRTPGRWGKVLIVVAVAAAAGTILYLKQRPGDIAGEAPAAARPRAARASAKTPAPLPRLVDLGSNRCQSCKAMEPVLEALTEEYRGRLDVRFIDVWDNPAEADRYRIHLIPTQIFFDAAGKELFRHEGFFSKRDILAKWDELGFELDG